MATTLLPASSTLEAMVEISGNTPATALGDLFGAIADAIDLGGLVIEDAGQLPVGVAHRRHARRHPGYGFDGFVDRVLDVVNLPADLGGGLGGLLRQRLDLGGDDGEAAAGGAGARRFDGGVEREQRGLRGDRLDQLDHGADALGRGGEAAHGKIGMAEIGDGAVGGVLGRRRFARAVGDQSEQPARRVRHRGDVAAGGSRRLDGVGGALRHVLVAGAEIAGGDADFLAGGLKRDGELVDGRAEALGEETTIGMAQPRFRLAAFQVDRQRVGIDQRLPHGFRGDRAVGERATLDLRRQRGIAVAAGDLRDRGDKNAQSTLAVPRHRERADECYSEPEPKIARSPGGQDGDGADEEEWQYDPRRQRTFKFVDHFGSISAGPAENSWRTRVKLRIFDY